MTNYGWECPKCGACWAPNQPSCMHCRPGTAVASNDPRAQEHERETQREIAALLRQEVEASLAAEAKRVEAAQKAGEPLEVGDLVRVSKWLEDFVVMAIQRDTLTVDVRTKREMEELRRTGDVPSALSLFRVDLCQVTKLGGNVAYREVER